MTTAVATLSQKQQQLLAVANSGALTGTQQGGSLPFKRLYIVREMGVETPSGESIALGEFHINDTDLHSTKILFRPLAIAMKLLSRLGPDEDYKVDGESVYFFNWNDERIDSKGGTSLGRIFGKQAKELSTEEQEANKDKAGLYLHLFGIASIDGNEELVMFSVSGGKYARVSSVMMNKKALGNIQPSQINFELETVLPSKDPMLSAKERKEAKNTYYNLLVNPIIDQVLPYEPVIVQLETVMDYITQHNDRVTEKHRMARQGGSSHDFDSNGGDYVDVEFEEVDAVMNELG